MKLLLSMLICNIAQYITAQCIILLLFSMVHYSTMHYSVTLKYSSVQSIVHYSFILQYSTIQYSTLHCISTMQYSTVEHHALQCYSAEQYSTEQHSTLQWNSAFLYLQIVPLAQADISIQMGHCNNRGNKSDFQEGGYEEEEKNIYIYFFLLRRQLYKYIFIQTNKTLQGPSLNPF